MYRRTSEFVKATGWGRQTADDVISAGSEPYQLAWYFERRVRGTKTVYRYESHHSTPAKAKRAFEERVSGYVELLHRVGGTWTSAKQKGDPKLKEAYERRHPADGRP